MFWSQLMFSKKANYVCFSIRIEWELCLTFLRSFFADRSSVNGEYQSADNFLVPKIAGSMCFFL